jgi:competence protein ComEA
MSTLILGIVLGVVLLEMRDAWQAPRIVISDPQPGSEIAVSITGAVATPGVYLLPGGSRIAHLIETAGGVAANSDLANINPAAMLHDEQQLFVPTIVPESTNGDDAEPHGTESAAFGIASGQDAPLNINTAPEEELDALPGIGPSLASLIVEERERLGGFDSVDDLVQISGISQRMVDDLRNLITT